MKDAPNRFMPTFCEEIEEEQDERTLESVNKDELLSMFNYNQQSGQWTRKTKQQQEKHDFADFLLNKFVLAYYVEIELISSTTFMTSTSPGHKTV